MTGATACCLVLAGTVEVFKTAGTHRETLALYGPADYFGEVSVLDGGDRSTSARRAMTVSLVILPREKFLDVLLLEPVPLTLNLFKPRAFGTAARGCPVHQRGAAEGKALAREGDGGFPAA